jgi:hypothetical protein
VILDLKPKPESIGINKMRTILAAFIPLEKNRSAKLYGFLLFQNLNNDFPGF